MGLLGSDKPVQGNAQPQSTDEQAIERYRYMLKTAPPETIEQAHAEAFAQLTPEQRRLLLQKLAEGMPASERASAEQAGANPQALARLATRAEIRKPGAMERMFGQAGGMSMGGLVAGSLLGSVAGTVLGSMIAREFFAGEGHGAGLSGASEPGQEEGSTDTDQAMDDGDSFDAGGGFDDVAQALLPQDLEKVAAVTLQHYGVYHDLESWRRYLSAAGFVELTRTATN